MNKACALLLLFIGSQIICLGQNLIPNGDFEARNNDICGEPQQNLKTVDNWYGFSGSPDIFNVTCPVPTMSEVFWTDNAAAFSGRNFIGLKCRVNSNQSYQSEGIAVELKNNLIAGQAYYLSAKVRNKGIYQGFPASVITCPLKPEKKIEIYTHSDSISVTNDFSNGSSIVNAELIGAVQSPALVSDIVSNEWATVSSCFVAQGSNRHMGIAMPIGNFGSFPPCAANDTEGTFFSFYFDLDDIYLAPLPTDTAISRTMEAGTSYEIFIPAELDYPFLSDATLVWEDGFTGARRTFDEPGKYFLNIVLDCGIIAVELNLLPSEEDFPYFVPNAFSPNDDGINDYLEIFIPSDKVVSNYNFSVYDRWGNRVFQSLDPSIFWDGKLDRKLSTGQYFYSLECEITDENGSQRYSKSDLVTVIY